MKQQLQICEQMDQINTSWEKKVLKIFENMHGMLTTLLYLS